jgi:hypothetical protein
VRTGSWGVRAGAVPVRSQHESQSLHHPGCSAREYHNELVIYVSESGENCRTLRFTEEH